MSQASKKPVVVEKTVAEKPVAAIIACIKPFEEAMERLIIACAAYRKARLSLLTELDATIKSAVLQIALHGQCTPIGRIVGALDSAGAKKEARDVAKYMNEYVKYIFEEKQDMLIYIAVTKDFSCVRAVWKEIKKDPEKAGSVIYNALDFSSWLAKKSAAEKAKVATLSPEEKIAAARKKAVEAFQTACKAIGAPIPLDAIQTLIDKYTKI